MQLTGENRSTRGKKTYPSATLSTTNPTWTDSGSNPGLRGGRPAYNCLNHDTALLGYLKSAVSNRGLQPHLKVIYIYIYIYVCMYICLL
jgi:hypothetical protein